MSGSSSDQSVSDFRRPFLLGLSLSLLIGGALLRWTAVDASNSWQQGASAMMVRVGIAFGALWFAWPSLRRPIRWLPPGVAAVVLVFVGAAVAQPRLLPALLPLAGGLATLAAVIRMLRGPSERRR